MLLYLNMNRLLVSLDQDHVLLDDWMLRKCVNWQFDFADRIQLGLVIVDLKKVQKY